MAAAGTKEVKAKLTSKTQSAINDLITLEKLVLKNSKSKDLITQSARNTVHLELTLDNSLNNLMKMQVMLTHLHYQADSVRQSFSEIKAIKEQLDLLQGSVREPTN